MAGESSEEQRGADVRRWREKSGEGAGWWTDGGGEQMAFWKERDGGEERWRPASKDSPLIHVLLMREFNPERGRVEQRVKDFIISSFLIINVFYLVKLVNRPESFGRWGGIEIKK
uniref:Uncharacterized protein n=1 Tax=Micrurus surinamensis TaxID=129470 RepID=A0A2D4PD08_MICSU